MNDTRRYAVLFGDGDGDWIICVQMLPADGGNPFWRTVDSGWGVVCDVGEERKALMLDSGPPEGPLNR